MSDELKNALVDIATPDPFVSMVESLATNKAIDADKLEKLVDVQLKVMAENARREFNVAMSAVEANLPQVARDAQNDQTRSLYARHETIARAIKPIYTQYGFSTSFSQAEGPQGFIRIRGTLRHVGGHEAEYLVDLPLDDKGIKGNVNKTPLHATGSTLTYGRRYLTCMMFDVATGDDTDGNMPPPPSLTPEDEADLYAKADELFGEKAEQVLRSLAKRRFHIGDGNWHDIPSYRLPDALRSLEEKAGES